MQAHRLALVCVLLLAACGGGGGREDDDRDEEGVPEPQLLAAVLFGGAIPGPPVELFSLALEGAARVELGSTTPEGGVRTLPPVDAALGGPEFALLAAQLTDGIASQGLIVEANRAGVFHSLANGDDGSLMVRLAPQAQSGQLDLEGHEITALQAILDVEQEADRIVVYGAVQVFGHPPSPSADGERAIALVPYNLNLDGEAVLPGRMQLEDVTLANLDDATIGLQDMVREVDDAEFAPTAAALTDGVAAPITTRFRPNDAPSHAFPRALLPLVDLPGEDLVGFQITGMRYHSWNAYNDRVVPKATQLEGAAVIYGRSP